MIEFDILAMKAETDEMHAIFLLKKNVRADIIKIILGYPPMAAPKMLKEWKVAITSVGQEYKSMESRNDYKTSTGTTFRGRRIPNLLFYSSCLLFPYSCQLHTLKQSQILTNITAI